MVTCAGALQVMGSDPHPEAVQMMRLRCHTHREDMKSFISHIMKFPRKVRQPFTLVLNKVAYRGLVAFVFFVIRGGTG